MITKSEYATKSKIWTMVKIDIKSSKLKTKCKW